MTLVTPWRPVLPGCEAWGVSTASEWVLYTEGLTKFYGDQRGVEDVTLRVSGGEVFGFLGPNGAGKTTTIRMLLGLIRPTRGRAEILGLDVREHGVRIGAQLGYLPGEPGPV